jgi:hypothetical protein
MIGNWVKESTATTGTGTMTLGALSGFTRFSDEFGVGASPYYVIQDGLNREFGIGGVGASNTLLRVTVLETLVAGVRTLNPGVGITLSGNAIVYAEVPATYRANPRKGSDVIAATTISTLFNRNGDIRDITGAATINGFSAIDHAGQIRFVRFTGICTLVHSASLICPGGVNITTANGDTAVLISLDTSNVMVWQYTRANGQGVMSFLPSAGGALAGNLYLGNNAVLGLRNACFNSQLDNGDTGPTVTLDFLYGQAQRIRLTASSVTVTLADGPGVGHYQLLIAQDNVGNRDAVFAGTHYSSGRWVGNIGMPTINKVANGETIVSLYWDGSQWYQTLALVNG